MIKAIIVCFAAALFFAYELVQLHMMNAISPFLMKDLHLTAQSFGYLTSSYLLADVIFLIPAGIILDRYSTRSVILGALFFCIAGTFGLAYSSTLWQAAVSHFFSGIGNAFCFLSCMMLIARWFPARIQSTAVGVMITIGLCGGLIGQTPMSALSITFGWREALMIDGLIGIGCAAIIAFFVEDAPLATAKKDLIEGKLTEAMHMQTICAGLYTGLMNLPIMVIGAVWGSLYLVQIHRLDLSTASGITSMICFGTIIGSPLFGLLSDRIGAKKPLMLMGAVGSLALFVYLLLVQSPSVIMLTLLFFLLGVFTSSQVLGYPMITESNPASLTGRAQGVAAVIIMGLALVVQSVSGVLIDMGWSGVIVDGTPIYAKSDFLRAFILFPIGFIFSIVSVTLLREKRAAVSI